MAKIVKAPTVTVGIQSFEKMRERKVFYVDKTSFIREWWELAEDVTLITRPRRFGKTLSMSMLECFFSIRYRGRGPELFKGLHIWRYKKFRALQGTFPVIHLSFARITEATTFKSAMTALSDILQGVFKSFRALKESSLLEENDKEIFDSYANGCAEDRLDRALWWLSHFLSTVEAKPVIILLDEYDVPLQEAWIYGYWEEMLSFMRAFYHSSFKDNTSLERGLITGIMSLHRKVLFSGFNNLRTLSVLTKGPCESSFGFSETEVKVSLERYGLAEYQNDVKNMYDGFIFGSQKGIYNPWSINNYLQSKGECKTWWVNTSANEVIERLLQEESQNMQINFITLLQGEAISTELDENIVFSRLEKNPVAVWTLLVEAGYLKAIAKEGDNYKLVITNGEVYKMLEKLILGWFEDDQVSRNAFTKAMLSGDINGMNRFMASVAESSFSVFDSGSAPSEKQPERFYHGFVLGLIIDLKNKYYVWSNRESGIGRYDVILEPKDKKKEAFILEFKVIEPKKEGSLITSVENALAQIESKKYATDLLQKGIPLEHIRKYGFAFCGKEVLIDDRSGVGRNAYREQQEAV